MDDYTAKELKRTVITIATSAAAAGLGLILTFLSWKQGEFSIIGVILVVGMVINIIPAVKRRRQILDEIHRDPKL